MRRLRVWAPLGVFTILLAVVAAGLFRPADRTVRSRMIGQVVPGIQLPPLLAEKPGIAAPARGRPYLLNVFASWCVPCAAEAPQLVRLRAMGIEIDAVAVRDKPGDVRAFLQRWGDPYRAIGDDPRGRMQLALGSSGVPETFVVDAAGRIVSQHVGDVREDDVAALAAEVRGAR